MSAIAQPFDNLIATVVRASELSIAYFGQTTTTEKTTSTDGAKRVTTTKTETNTKTGKVVKKTTTTTDYTEREGHPNRKEKKKTTEVETRSLDEDGNDRKTTTEVKTPDGGSKTTVVNDPAGSSPKRTVSEEEKDADGKTTKKTDYHDAPGNGKKSETEYKDGQPTKTTEWDKNGTKTKETEYGPDGKPTKETRYDEKGNKKSEFSDFDKAGNPRKITTYDEKGRKVSEGTLDGEGKVTERIDYDEKGRPIRKVSPNGDIETTEYNNDGSIRRKVVYHPDGSKDETEYEGGKPKRSIKRDSEGRPISNSQNPFGDPSNILICAPNSANAGQSFQLTVATLTGQVIANAPVTIDGGAMGKIEATTDLNGVVTAKTPDNWKSAKIIAGGIVTSMIINSLRPSPSAPAIINPPQFIQPGSIVNIPCNGMPGTLSGQTVMFGNKPAKVLAASSTSMKILAPIDAPAGPTTVTMNANGQTYSFDTCAIKLSWDSNQPKMVVGQTSTRTLIIEGTDKPVDVFIEDRMNDAVTVNSVGKFRTSGGARNTVSVRFIADRVGTFTIPATCPTGNTEYEKDLEKAEAAKKEAAGWKDSADAQTDDTIKENFRKAAYQWTLAATNWAAAADARMRGNEEKAKELEAAAADREEAAAAYADGKTTKGKACEASAAMHERNAAGM